MEHQLYITDDFPVHRAAHLGEERLLQQLIAAGHSVNRTTYDNVTPLHDACLAGNTRCAVLLIDAGALINASNIDGATPLCDAANNGNVDCVQLLLSKGATVNPQLNYTTPLHEAILRDHVSVAELLILNGANLNANDLHFGTPLHVTAFKDHVTCARTLLRLGANVNATKMHQTALHLAARQDSLPMIELLLDAGAGLYARNNQGHLAKHFCSRGHAARDMLDFYEKNPFSLMHWCRLAVRRCINVNRLKDMQDLKLPQRLTLYMEHRI